MKICPMASRAVELSLLSLPGTLGTVVSHCHSILQVSPILLVAGDEYTQQAEIICFLF